MPGHRSRGRAALPTTSPPAPERRTAAAGRCKPRRSRGTLKDGRCRPEPYRCQQDLAARLKPARPMPWRRVIKAGRLICVRAPTRQLSEALMKPSAHSANQHPAAPPTALQISHLQCSRPQSRHSTDGTERTKPRNLLTYLLTTKALGPPTPVAATGYKDYNLSLLSSRSMVRIHQGAFQAASTFGRWPVFTKMVQPGSLQGL